MNHTSCVSNDTHLANGRRCHTICNSIKFSSRCHAEIIDTMFVYLFTSWFVAMRVLHTHTQTQTVMSAPFHSAHSTCCRFIVGRSDGKCFGVAESLLVCTELCSIRTDLIATLHRIKLKLSYLWGACRQYWTGAGHSFRSQQHRIDANHNLSLCSMFATFNFSLLNGCFDGYIVKKTVEMKLKLSFAHHWHISLVAANQQRFITHPQLWTRSCLSTKNRKRNMNEPNTFLFFNK